MKTLDCDIGAMAKDILANTKETPWNKEYLDAWREVAVAANVEKLYNTAEIYE